MRVSGILPFFTASYQNGRLNNNQYTKRTDFVLKPDTFERADVSFGQGHQYVSIYKMSNMHCAYCDKLMIAQDMFEKLLKKTEGKTARAVLKIFQPYYERLEPHRQKVFDEIKRLAEKQPKNRIENIMSYRWKNHLNEVENRQKNVFKQIETIDLGLSCKTINKLRKFLNQAKEILFSKTGTHMGRRKQVFDEFAKLKDSSKEKKQLEVIEAMLYHLPSSEKNLDAFFVKHVHSSTSGVMRDLFQPAFISKDHVTAQANDITQKSFKNNYLYAHRWCNNVFKADKTLAQLIPNRPKLPVYIQQQTDEIADGINNGILDPRAFDLKGLQKRIYTESNHQISVQLRELRPPSKKK